MLTIENLERLTSLDATLPDDHNELLDFYRWCRQHLSRPFQEELKREQGLNLRRKADRIQFAQASARQQLEQLGYTVMAVPSHLVGKVNQLIDGVNQPNPETPSLDRDFELQTHNEFEPENQGFHEIKYNYYQQVALSELHYYMTMLDELRTREELPEGPTPEEKNLASFTHSILKRLKQYDRKYQNKQPLFYCRDIFLKREAEVDLSDLLPDLYKLGLIQDDIGAQPSTVQEFWAWRRINTDFCHDDLLSILGEAISQGRFDICSAIGVGKRDPINPSRYWEAYFNTALDKVGNRRTIHEVTPDYFSKTWKDNIKQIPRRRIEQLDWTHPLRLLTDFYSTVDILSEGYSVDVIKWLRGDLKLDGIGLPDYRELIEKGRRTISDCFKEVGRIKDWLEKNQRRFGADYLGLMLKTLFRLDLSEVVGSAQRWYDWLMAKKTQQEERKRREREQRYQTCRNQPFTDQFRQWLITMDITAEATVQELKRKYRHLAQQYHPDLGGDEVMMKRLNEAYHGLLSYYQKNTA